MRYSHLKSFQKHLQSAAPGHLCKSYLILVNHDYERGQLLEQAAHSAGGATHHFRASEGNWKLFWEALQGPSLFHASGVVVLDEAEQLPQSVVRELQFRLKDLSIYLILGARGKCALTVGVEQHGVVLDLTEEKSWDRDRRWGEQLIERARMEGKILEPSAVAGLFERLDLELSLLEREVDKLICFVGPRVRITIEDVKAVSAESRAHTLWKVAEGMVWERQPAPLGSDLYGLIPALRWNLQIGLKLHMGQPVPNMAPKRLEQRRAQAAQLGLSFFQKGLNALFEIELLSRSVSISADAALDLFQLKLNI